MSVRNLGALFQPLSVALIGASDREGSVGAVLLRNLQRGGFKGPIWPVNHRHSTVAGLTAWPSVNTLPQTPDLAVICTPAESVPGLIDELGRRGTRAAIVISAGLQRSSNQSGVSIEQAMLNAARPHLLRILGPNCIGAIVPGIGLNASFAPGNALHGKLAFVTQSGALATAMLDWANERSIGFSHFISLGNSADVDFGDVIDYLASDPSTRAILMYAESIKAARKFMSASRAAARNKPLIVVKAGRASQGAKAAASHTGALAGSDAVFEAAAQRAGMLRVGTLEALFDAAQTLSYRQPWRGERLAVLTNGGGAGVLAADALESGGGVLARLESTTMQALSACLPDTWSQGNPVDIIGDAPVSRYENALRILLRAPEVDGVLFMHAPTAIVGSADIAAACLPIMSNGGKPVLLNWLGGATVLKARQLSAQSGLPSYNTPERAVAGWLQLSAYVRNQQTLQNLPSMTLEDFEPDIESASSIAQQALQAGQEWLDAAQSHALLHAYGISSIETVRVSSVDQAMEQAKRLGFPVALKIESPQIIHKSDIGGVALNLKTVQAVEDAAHAMLQTIAHVQPQAQILGFTVQAMAQRAQAHEFIVGIACDAVFGPVVLFGEGGLAVELSKEHAVALPPLNATLAGDLITRSGLRPLLASYRGRPCANEHALIDTITKVSQMACDLPWLSELDINPLLVDAHGVLALDARVRLRTPLPGERSRLAISPYPNALQEQVRLDGKLLVVRPIRPEDALALREFYAQASVADMRLRFFVTRRQIPHSELARYSQIDYDREMTFVAMVKHEDKQCMAGEVLAVCDPDNQRAEFAIQIASSWQGKGLGRILLQKMIAHLRARGTAELVGQCLRENDSMMALARDMGFRVRPSPSEDALDLHLLLYKR
jgi:acetyltransferase